MSRSILDDNYDQAKRLLMWLEGSVEATNEWHEGGAEASARRQEAWGRIERIALQLSDHAKHAAEAEECEPL